MVTLLYTRMAYTMERFWHDCCYPSGMYNKFIISQTGTLIFGNVYLHRDLLPSGEDTCWGGGLWQIDNQRGIVLLYGRSFDFGAPDFSRMLRVDRSGINDLDYPIFYQRRFCDEEVLEKID